MLFALPPLPAGVTPALFIVCTVLAVVLTGIAKAGFGGGIGIIAVPLTIAVLDPRAGLGFMLPILITGDIFSFLHHRHNRSNLHCRWLVLGAFGGIALATILLLVLQHAAGTGDVETHNKAINRGLYLVVGGSCLLMVAAQAYRMIGGRLPHIPSSAPAGYTTGGLAGFVSTLAHSAGPVINVYLLEEELDKSLHVGTAVLFYLFVNLGKVPAYVGLGYMTAATFKTSLLFLPLVPVGTCAGSWMHKRVPEKPFAIILYLGAAAGAAWMLWSARH
jgi:uncharacterized membrane protein YfcA